MITALAYMTAATILASLCILVWGWIDRRDAQREWERRNPPRRR